ncbi:low-density lipoprotein receptor-related protein 1 [Pectinophora gossypiella]|uniref:low-density lipoprotein receptor-related protein 1 n=1 Tax=Pectinophora gossypiella TaxID=13191 RepID=UPI00214EB564|nr:low-density lipoprotein receptor-related protein 1 [Pectinophora gossypiella]
MTGAGTLVLVGLVAGLVASSGAADAGTTLPNPGIPGEELTPSEVTCDAGQWRCADGARCVPLAWRCDGRPHCADASDEFDCTWNTTCSGQFRCARSGLCIAESWRCDGDPDCGPKDASDEDPYMCEKDFKCPGNEARCATPIAGQFTCVAVSRFCDGVRDCLDGSDEWDICDNFTQTQCAPLGCKEGCKPTHEGLACYCKTGFEPNDGKCVDTDECVREEACSQSCHNTVGSFQCACVAGYVMQPDGKTCLAVNEPQNVPASLIVATQTDLRHVWHGPHPTHPNDHRHSIPALGVRAVDYLYANGTVCYVHHNMSKSGITCVKADDFSQRTLLPIPALFPDVNSVSHMAIDWISLTWYLVDEGREALYCCSHQLSHCRLLLDSGLNKLHGFAIDPTQGYMFWTVWGAAAPTVGRADLAGQNRTSLASLKLVYPSALTLDLANKMIYWADTYLECIERADYDGNHRLTIRRGYVTQKLQHISLLETTLFLPVWGNSTIAMVPRYSRDRRRAGEVALDARPTAVLAYHRQRQPTVPHPCAVNKGGCAHMCVTSYRAGRPHAFCLCTHGYRLSGLKDCVRAELDSYLVVARGSPPLVQALALRGAHAGWEALAPATDAARPTAADVDVRAGYLYYCDVHRYEIVRQKLSGADREVFIEQDVDNCEGIAVDWMARNLYWTDDALGRVSVASLDTGTRRALVHEPNFNPRSIVLDPANGLMYWSVWASAVAARGRIEAARLDASSRRTLLDTDLLWPNGLALDLDKNVLYWCDTYLNKIEKMALPAGKRELVAQNTAQTPLLKPYGLALYEGAILWSEHGTGVIKKLENGNVTVVHTLPPPLYDLKLISNTARIGANKCSYNKGGCSELCLWLGAGQYTCACGEGRVLDATNRSCVLSTAPAAPRCTEGRFHCGRGRCIDALYVCDGDADCPDGSDEDSSPAGPCANVTCSQEQFMQCDTNRCIPKNWVCDGLTDCADGADETAHACSRIACGPDQFACATSRRCIPAAWRCDGARDCGRDDPSDERDCRNLECSEEMFRCSNGACVPWEYNCDGHADCADASDERACPTPPTIPGGTGTNHTPSPPNRLHPHHDDRTRLCEDHEFQCKDQECIRMEFRCDSRVDCLDGSDEADCTEVRPKTTTTPAPTQQPVEDTGCVAPALRCDNNTRCVPLLQLCDDNADCADNSDEADRCGEPMCLVAACSHICHPTPQGPVCACPAALHLQRDGLTCADHHVCTEWGVCSQSCVPQKNRHKCTCFDGFQLADDGFTCKSTDKAVPLLVFSNRHEVRGVELPSLASRALISSLKNTIALDWRRDPKTGSVDLYWTDVVDDNIYKGTIIGNALSGIEVVVQQGLSTAEGLAVDWVAGNLYWVESSLHQIEVARLDGQYRRTLIAGDMDSPRAIAVDPNMGYLFWSDWEQAAPRIERCSLAGRHRVGVVRVDALTDGAWPNGITLDHLSKRLYWIDARSDSIHTTTYDGTDYHEVLRGHAALSHPFAITVWESHVYWTDWRSNSVVRANKWNGSDVAVVQRTLTQPFDIKVIHPSRQPISSHNPCGVNNGNCSHLCLIDAPDTRVCACPHVMRLAKDNVTCEVHEKVLLYGRAGEIRGVDLEEPRVHIIPTVSGPHLTSPAVLQLLPSETALFWADTETNEIKRIGLTGGPVRVIADSGVETPRGFALDWAARLLYYSTGSALAVCNLAGEYTTLLYTDLHNLTSLAVDPLRGKLYWSATPSSGERIEMANGDGSGRRLLADTHNDPQLAGVTSLCVDVESNTLYWVNIDSATMQYLDVRTGKITTLPLGVGARPAALDVYGGEVLWADSEDNTLRACGRLDCSKPRLLRNNTEGVISLRVYDASIQNGSAGACALRRSACAQLCLPVSRLDSVCRCATGYARDGARCRAVDEVLVYSGSWEIRGLSLTGNDTSNVLPPIAQLSMASSIDYHAEGEWVYWADSEGGSVWRIKRDGTARALLLHHTDPLDAHAADWLAGLAVDWVGGNMYWSDPRRNLVEVARLDGSHRYVLLDTDPDAVTTLAVDPVRGWLFLSGGGWIQRARLDGSSRDLLYNGTAVADIAIDSKNELIYWADTWDVSVWRMQYSGLGRTQLARGAPFHHPVALALHNNTLYWLDTMLNRGSVVSAPLSNLSDYRVLKDNAGDSLKDILIWSQASQSIPAHNSSLAANPCGRDNGGCAALCLYDGARARCACPHGDLAADGKNCTPYTSFLMYSRVTKIDSIHLRDEKDLNSPYPPIQNMELMRNAISLAYDYSSQRLFYSDIQRGSINTVHFNGSDHRVLLEQVAAVEGMVFASHTGELYWTCTSAAAIRSVKLSALASLALPDRASVLRTVLRLPTGARPRGLDIDPCESRLYWTNWNESSPSIQRAYTSGLGLQSIVSTDIMMPNGLALDHKAKKIYWADARLDKIERMHYDGSHRHIVTQSSTQHPFDVAVAGDYVFWTDWVAHGVFRADKRAGDVTALRRDVPRPMAVVAVTDNHQICSRDPCLVLNGGCAEICTMDESGLASCHCGAGRELSSDLHSCRPLDSVCADNQFSCAEGACIPNELVCDGVPHCSDTTDASDEDLYFCTSRVCPAGWVPCGAGGRCVAARGVCDGRADCDDGTDEAGCDCQPTQFKCDDGMCVEITARCDGVLQCADASDERACALASCAALGPQAVPCGAGADCYMPAWRCDNHTDCPNGEDEVGCQEETEDSDKSIIDSLEESGEGCGPLQFTCGSSGASKAGGAECVPLAWRCDGRADCTDGSDETLHCGHTNTSSCTSTQFACGTSGPGGGPCVPLSARCDGVAHCPHAEDENNCACAAGAFRCVSSGACLNAELYCDGDSDCVDGSDEPPGCSPRTPAATLAPPAPLCAGMPGALYCSGKCIPRELLCDARDHCLDGLGQGAGSDEDPYMCASFTRAFGSGVEQAVAPVGACARGHWQCGNGACVPVSALCDGDDDCGDLTDEWHCNINECLTMNGECAHNCTDLAVGFACWCRPGWRRAGAGACADVDECQEDEPCDHHCRNTMGSFVCSCAKGYRLMSDGISCAPISSIKASLIFTNRYYIRRAPLEPTAHEPPTSLIVHNLTNAVALDMEWASGCLYWSDVTRLGSSIKRVCRASSVPASTSDDYQLLHGATLQNPDGLAVDWVAHVMYWCDKGTDTIEVSRLDGQHRRVLLRGGLSEPRALALHPARGTIYWSDWGARPHIGRAGMDGSQRAVIIGSGLGWPNALTVLHHSNELYFADAREDYIAVADLDGKHVRVLFSRERMPWLQLHHVFALAVWEGRVYWSDWETRAIESCRRRPNPHYKETNTTNLSAGGAYECKTVVHVVHKPMDLRIFHPARQPEYPELSALCEKLNCSGLCLLTPAPEGGTAGATCACPEHFVLNPDGRTCAPNCTSAHFVCKTALKCIPFWWRCDTQDDCGDGSDEPASCRAFRCAPGQFQCNNGHCVHPSQICDGHQQCGDGSDETDCDEFTCLSSQFKCPGNATAGVAARCIPGAAACDGRHDCPGGADERHCPPRTCPPLHFTCGNGACVPLVWVCDTDGDCGDGSDEGALCAHRHCARDEFRCASGRCIPREWLCDAEADCPGREDEAECSSRSAPPCEPTYFRCPSGKCIPGRWRCDFEDDCGDRADEMNCQPRNCSETEFRCSNGECIRGSLRCSGAAECSDGSDERQCAPTCSPQARACNHTPECVLNEWWCDGEADCGDGSDEAECAPSAEAAPACGSRLACRGPRAACLPAAWRCDGKRDCADGSDESAQACAVACHPPMFRCDNGKCVPPNFVCDGYDDCSDQSDENKHLCVRLRSACLLHESMCDDGRCVPLNASCAIGGPCNWQTCSQLCLPKHNQSHVCKCVPGYKQRTLPDGSLTCEGDGDKAKVIVAESGVLRMWELHKQEHDHSEEPVDIDKSEITSIAVALLGGRWWAWWADAAGRMRRLDVTEAAAAPPAPLAAHLASDVVRDGGIIRGIAIDAVSQRVYWTAVQAAPGRAGVGAVYCAALDGRRRRTLYSSAGAEPDDIVIHNATRQMIWSDRGSDPGIMIASLDGGAPRWLVRRRLRRPGALALYPPANRLYFLDTYYDTLESVKIDGSDRVTIAVFTHFETTPANHKESSNKSWPAVAAGGRACVRMAAWEEWVWCGTRRGLVRVARRGGRGGRGAAAAARPQLALTALAILHPTLFLQPGVDPCVKADGSPTCHPSALCVRSSSSKGYSCLCPDGLSLGPEIPPSPTGQDQRQCIISSPPSASNTSCPLLCGVGSCERDARGNAQCRCPPLYDGAHCQHYRCMRHCLHRGHCMLNDDGISLKCICPAGYTGGRCELPVSGGRGPCARHSCENGGTCVVHHYSPRCQCPPQYTGVSCEQCSDKPECPAGSVCVWTDGEAQCSAAICNGFCFNQGTCAVSQDGRVSCSCPPPWAGDRCQSRACVDADCATNNTNDSEYDDHDYRPHPMSECNPGECKHGGQCLGAQGGRVCRCVGAWGGPRCDHYVGHDHACIARACPPASFCAWKPMLNHEDAGVPFCACYEGARCSAAEAGGAGAAGAAGGGHGAWGGAAVALLVLVAAVLAALYVIHRRRHGAFVHARLADNVEINNPMYLAGEDEPEPRLNHTHSNGGNHFANPVYESMYAPQQNNPTEEHANLLDGSGDGSPPPAEQAALL